MSWGRGGRGLGWALSVASHGCPALLSAQQRISCSQAGPSGEWTSQGSSVRNKHPHSSGVRGNTITLSLCVRGNPGIAVVSRGWDTVLLAVRVCVSVPPPRPRLCSHAAMPPAALGSVIFLLALLEERRNFAFLTVLTSVPAPGLPGPSGVLGAPPEHTCGQRRDVLVAQAVSRGSGDPVVPRKCSRRCHKGGSGGWAGTRDVILGTDASLMRSFYYRPRLYVDAPRGFKKASTW